ncbi:MAG TPA: NAD(P)/FAD-dependent oxidoreductase [Casimicrobiaceae bacterium]|nr:NAD(P)/FAD-dependent oxidoreductase [Casimicrobiaceae bacterium]
MTAAAPTSYRIVIVGGGAGGLPLAARLPKSFKAGRVSVTLVDEFQTHVWKPLLHEVAAGRMDAAAHDLDYLALAHLHGFRFRQGPLAGIDRARHEITIGRVVDEEGEEILPIRVLGYDMLILCVGSVSNDFGVPGVAQHAIAIDTPPEAERFHRKLIAACVRADGKRAGGDDAEVCIVIIGAGATGVELAAEIRQTTRAHAAYGLDHLRPGDIRITVVEAAARVLPPLPESIATAATELLRRLDVTVRTNERVIGVEADGVRVASGELLRADLVVWAAGIKAPRLLSQLDGLEVNRNHQLVVRGTLQTTRDPDVFAFGDCADCPWPHGDQPNARVPPRAQAARQQGQMLVRTVAARLRGKPLPVFRFRDYGSLVSLGELSAVGNLMGRLIGGNMLIQGLIARWMYESLYKLHQIALLGLFRVALDTVGRFLRGRVAPRVKLH